MAIWTEIIMVRPVVSSIALASLLIASSAFGCDVSNENKVTSPTNRPVSKLFSSKRISNNSLKALEQSINTQINQYRQSRNLPPLTLDSRISEQARAHSQAMANSGVLSHDGFDQRVKAIARLITYRGAAENVAYNQGYSNPGEQAVQGWIKSPGHQKNMVGDYDLTGIGVAKNAKGEYYFTQIFIKRR
jgi:uncharacterized protein YkwD